MLNNQLFYKRGNQAENTINQRDMNQSTFYTLPDSYGFSTAFKKIYEETPPASPESVVVQQPAQPESPPFQVESPPYQPGTPASPPYQPGTPASPPYQPVSPFSNEEGLSIQNQEPQIKNTNSIEVNPPQNSNSLLMNIEEEKKEEEEEKTEEKKKIIL